MAVKRFYAGREKSSLNYMYTDTDVERAMQGKTALFVMVQCQCTVSDTLFGSILVHICIIAPER